MQYFGIPRCPYCKKRVNMVTTWSLKKQGEYICPRCSGISNIYLSPIIYVAAVLTVFTSAAIYFFNKFVIDDIEPMTTVQVIVPFVIFFLLSIFMVYLKKPVMKRVSREDMEKGKKRSLVNADRTGTSRKNPRELPNGNTSRIIADNGDYQPNDEYITKQILRADTSSQDLSATIAVDISENIKNAKQNVRSTRPNSTNPMKTSRNPVVSSDTSRADNGDFFDKYNDESYINKRLEELRNGREE